MWVRWSENVDLSIDGVDAIVHGPNGDLFLPASAELITRLRDLLGTVRSTHTLEAELAQYTSATHAASLLRDLIAEQALLVWELGADLVQLHQSTVAPAKYPVLPPAAETARILRESGGRHSVSLPYPEATPIALSKVLSERRTCRQFIPHTETSQQLGNVLGMSLAAGTFETASPMMPGGPAAHRTYPSGGALYPVEILAYPATVAKIPSAFYYYQALAHRLVPVAPPRPAQELKQLLSDHPVEGASCYLFLYLDFMRVAQSRYGLKSYRLALLEGGHIAQSVLLSAAAVGLAGLPLCGFDDRCLSQAAGLDYPEEAVIYAIAIGRPGDPAHG